MYCDQASYDGANPYDDEPEPQDTENDDFNEEE